VHQWNRDGSPQDVEDVIRAAAHDTECPELVKEAVVKTVRASSWSQSLKNIPTAGVVKSIRYSAAKVQKMWKSLQKSWGIVPRPLQNDNSTLIKEFPDQHSFEPIWQQRGLLQCNSQLSLSKLMYSSKKYKSVEFGSWICRGMRNMRTINS